MDASPSPTPTPASLRPRLLWASLALLAAPGCVQEKAEAQAAEAHLAQPQAQEKAGVKRVQPQGGHERMLAALRGIYERTEQENIFLGGSHMRALEQQLAAIPAEQAVARLQTLIELGDATVYYGNEREGLALLKQAYEQLPALAAQLPAGAVEEFKLRYATCWLRLAETENCCANHTAESCILPLQGGALHTRKEGSQNAMALLREVLDSTEKSSQVHRTAQWFFNMTAMTLGQYPDAVPEEHRVPLAFFDPDVKFPRFVNVSEKVGLDFLNLAGSVVADDFDNDHDLDLLMTGYGSDGQLEFFRNNGDGTFTKRTKEANLSGLFGGLNLVQADYDNDGFVDALVLRGAWLGKLGEHPNSLLHNNGDGTFTDMTYEAGLAVANYPSMNASWSDYDADGDLDLFIGNEQGPDNVAPCQLFQNKGDGTFVDVAKAAGVTNDRFTKSVVAGDYDADGDPDFYVSNLYAENRLYRNNGDGTFTDVAKDLGLTGPHISYPAFFFDQDNDGALDLLVLAFQAQPHDLVAAALGQPFEANLPSLYRNDGKGGFEEIGRASGLTKPFSVMGCNVGDFDNDGFLDFYAGTGRPQAREIVPDMAYHNLRGKGFENVTFQSGLGHLQKGHGRTFADLDGDGDLDIVAQMGGAFRADLFRNAVYENPGFGNNWLALRLEGRQSNRSAIGARVRADIVDGTEKRSIHRWVNSGSTFGANPLRVHLGLGKATKVETLEVYWPTTGKKQVFKDLPAGRLGVIVEGEAQPTWKDLKAAHLGGADH